MSTEDHQSKNGKGHLFVMAFLALIAIVYGINYMESKSKNDSSPVVHIENNSADQAAIEKAKMAHLSAKEQVKVLESKIADLKTVLEKTQSDLQNSQTEVSNYKNKMDRVKQLINADKMISKTEDAI